MTERPRSSHKPASAEEPIVFVIDDDESMRRALTNRFQSVSERDVLALVSSGLMNEQVAAELGLAEITVKLHRGHIMRKMGAKSLADLVRKAEVLGIRRNKPWRVQT